MRAEWVTEDHWRSLRREGYAVFRGVVGEGVARPAARAIADRVGADLEDRSTWYGGCPENDGVVPMHQAQALWDLRQEPNVHAVFSELWGTSRLYVDVNRCCFRPPADPAHLGLSLGEIHWDTDPRGPRPSSLQGVVLLSDVGRDAGGYHCVPGIYRDLERWLERHARAPEFDFFNPGVSFDEAVQIEGLAGDLIVWSTQLPHGPAPNLSDRPRIAAYVAMGPPPDDPLLLGRMERWWREKRAPPYWRGLPGQLDPEPGPPARLTPLGRKLIGLDAWD